MKCRSCSAEILFVRLSSGKTMPVDERKSIVGNIELRDGIAYVVPCDGETPRYISHFATCPQAGAHRREAL